jgi:hypothetical protein
MLKLLIGAALPLAALAAALIVHQPPRVMPSPAAELRTLAAERQTLVEAFAIQNGISTDQVEAVLAAPTPPREILEQIRRHDEVEAEFRARFLAARAK